MNDPRLLVVGTGSPTFRLYALEHLKHSGFHLALAGDRPERWQHVADDFLELGPPPYDSSAVARLTDFGARNGVEGAWTYSEEHVSVTARVGESLGLPHLSRRASALFRNKFEMRKALLAQGIPVPRFALAVSATDAVAASCALTFPLVVKPVNGHSSIGVTRCDSVAEVEAAASAIMALWFEGRSPEILIEEYVDGPELCCEVIVRPDAPAYAAVLDKGLSDEPYFEETRHTIPSRLSPVDQTAVSNTALDAVAVLGLTRGTANVELRLSRRGPVIIEAAARLGGDFLPKIIHLATGVDVVLAAGLLACGRTLEVAPSRSEAASVAFLVPTQEGIVKTISSRLVATPHVISQSCWATPGMSVQLPPNAFLTRLGYVITTADSPDASERAALAALDQMDLQVG